MIHLREIRPEDAPLMLEWMHNPNVQKGLRKNVLSMTLEQAEAFCCNAALPHSLADGLSAHFAIAGDGEEYLGTISLKNADITSRRAEYAIVVIPSAQNRGIGRKATALLLEKAFCEYGLHKVYLEVLADNIQAIKMYEHAGFHYTGEYRDHLFLNGRFHTLKLYEVLESEFFLAET